MSLGAIFGLVALNFCLLGVGSTVLYCCRGWASWGELVRLSGLAYMCGVASMGILWVWQLAIGIDLSLAAILIGCAAVATACAIVGRCIGRRLPPRPRFGSMSRRGSVVAAGFAALVVVYLEAQFRAGRLAGLYEFDAWSFWVPKAKAIYYFGGLDPQFFHDLPGQSYPPLVPALEAAAFQFMGSADEVTLHLQFWFLLMGFVAALVGLLSGRIAPLLLWPPLLLVLVTPHVVDYALQPQADFLLDELFALAALLLALWLCDRDDAAIRVAALFLAAVMLTKREGYVLALCAVMALLGATWKEARRDWPRLAILGLLAFLVTIPWRVLLAGRHLPGGGPEAGGTGLFGNLERAWPSLRLAASTLFDPHIWLIVVPLLALAILVGGAVSGGQLPAYAALLALLCVAAMTWSTWAFPSLPVTKTAALNPIVRFSGALVLAAGGLIPMLLHHARDSLKQTR